MEVWRSVVLRHSVPITIQLLRQREQSEKRITSVIGSNQTYNHCDSMRKYPPCYDGLLLTKK